MGLYKSQVNPDANRKCPLFSGEYPKEGSPPKSGFTLVYVEATRTREELALLLHSFGVARSARHDLHSWLVGDGNGRPRLENLSTGLGISDYVTFWGQQL